jgi:hypothetical protein
MFVLLLLCISFSSCSRKGAVTVKAAPPEVQITNASNETVHYVVYPAHVLAYVTIVPTCTEENALKAGETKSVSYETILQKGTDDEAVIYWWQCDEGETQTTVGKAHVIRVSL